MKKLVQITCLDVTDNDMMFMFSISVHTVEWADLSRFIELGFPQSPHSLWLQGIHDALLSMQSGYFFNGSPQYKYEICNLAEEE